MAAYSSILAWKIHGQRSLVGYSPWVTKESDTAENTHTQTSNYVTSKETYTDTKLLKIRDRES